MKEIFLDRLFALLIGLAWIHASSGALSGWSSSPTQYHVQNDEGPERFFRYQTFNGQFRKERRMDDGTVVGSYGWVDPSGYLRMTDYIADGKGYRIVKSRMEFVGVKPDASAPEVKPSEQMKHSTRVVRQRHPETFVTTAEPPINVSTALATASTVPTTTTPLPVLDSEFTTPYSQRPVKARHRGQPTPRSLHLKPTLATVMRPPKRRVVKVLRRPPLRNVTLSATMLPPPLDATRITFTVPPPPEEFTGSRPYVIQVTRGDERSGRRNDVFKGYATPLKNENGSGFLYKIPNQFHKEETESDGSRVGSFGYVDPFGIRRVIHYNAGNTGFAHKVDFKYVGDGEQ